MKDVETPHVFLNCANNLNQSIQTDEDLGVLAPGKRFTKINRPELSSSICPIPDEGHFVDIFPKDRRLLCSQGIEIFYSSITTNLRKWVDESTRLIALTLTFREKKKGFLYELTVSWERTSVDHWASHNNTRTLDPFMWYLHLPYTFLCLFATMCFVDLINCVILGAKVKMKKTDLKKFLLTIENLNLLLDLLLIVFLCLGYF